MAKRGQSYLPDNFIGGHHSNQNGQDGSDLRQFLPPVRLENGTEQSSSANGHQSTQYWECGPQQMRSPAGFEGLPTPTEWYHNTTQFWRNGIQPVDSPLLEIQANLADLSVSDEGSSQSSQSQFLLQTIAEMARPGQAESSPEVEPNMDLPDFRQLELDGNVTEPYSLWRQQHGDSYYFGRPQMSTPQFTPNVPAFQPNFPTSPPQFDRSPSPQFHQISPQQFDRTLPHQFDQNSSPQFYQTALPEFNRTPPSQFDRTPPQFDRALSPQFYQAAPPQLNRNPQPQFDWAPSPQFYQAAPQFNGTPPPQFDRTYASQFDRAPSPQFYQTAPPQFHGNPFPQFDRTLPSPFDQASSPRFYQPAPPQFFQPQPVFVPRYHYIPFYTAISGYNQSGQPILRHIPTPTPEYSYSYVPLPGRVDAQIPTPVGTTVGSVPTTEINNEVDSLHANDATDTVRRQALEASVPAPLQNDETALQTQAPTQITETPLSALPVPLEYNDALPQIPETVSESSARMKSR